MTKNTKIIFSTNLQKYMKLHDLNQEDIAKITHVSQQSVSNWINGQFIPRMGVIEKMATYFGIMKSDLLEDKSRSTTNGVRIPVLGVVPAGIPIEAVEDIIDYEEIDLAMAAKGEYFGLKILGDSMSPNILDDDVVIVRKQSSIENGDIAIVLVNGFDATCKKILLKENAIILQPLNPSYETVFYSSIEVATLPVQVVGKVVEMRRKF